MRRTQSGSTASSPWSTSGSGRWKPTTIWRRSASTGHARIRPAVFLPVVRVDKGLRVGPQARRIVDLIAQELPHLPQLGHTLEGVQLQVYIVGGEKHAAQAADDIGLLPILLPLGRLPVLLPGGATAVLVRTDSLGRPLTVLYAAQDVTESKQKEAREHRALQEACQAANHASAAKSDFLSRMSHGVEDVLDKRLVHAHAVVPEDEVIAPVAVLPGLPLPDLDLQQEEPEDGRTVSLQGRRLLLAEDNELNREIACEILGGVGAEVECARDGPP